ncbi:MAG: hypothetical protein ACRENQ_16770, partial [Gemmatimonadaceae bacterium]
SQAADTLIGEYLRDSVPWIDIDDLRSGTLVARLKLGDLTGARRAYTALAPDAARSNFTAQLLAADLAMRRVAPADSMAGRE